MAFFPAEAKASEIPSRVGYFLALAGDNSHENGGSVNY